LNYTPCQFVEVDCFGRTDSCQIVLTIQIKFENILRRSVCPVYERGAEDAVDVGVAQHARKVVIGYGFFGDHSLFHDVLVVGRHRVQVYVIVGVHCVMGVDVSEEIGVY